MTQCKNKKRSRRLLGHLLLAAALLCLAGCKRSGEKKEYTLVYGGDLFFGRGVNEALYNPEQKKQMFEDVGDLFRNADVALVNGEGVIATGGYLFNKGEPRPFMFRAHPEMIDVLKETGIDVVNAGNNHGCDYGPEALREMMQRLRKAGIDYTGAGMDVGDARTASFHRMGDLTVAVIGADMTIAGACAVDERRPGVLYYDITSPQASIDTVVRDLSGVLANARKHADLVFLTPHWGDNGKDAPTETTRLLARKLIKAGFDGILGHSAHRFQGVELIDGKPVIYDAGQLLDDMGGARALIWELKLTAKGVTSLTGHPITLRRNRTMNAEPKIAESIIRRLQQLSRPLETPIFKADNTARVYCSPGEGKRAASPPPERPVPESVQLAAENRVRDALPPDVTEAEVVYENGITVRGYKLYTDKLFVPKAAQVVELYLSSDRPLEGNIQVQLEATAPNGRRDIDRHIPGDWLMPVARWPEGKIIVDRRLFRLKATPKGTLTFSAAIMDTYGRYLKPVRSSLPLEGETRILLGEGTYTPGAPRIYHFIGQIDAARAAGK